MQAHRLPTAALVLCAAVGICGVPPGPVVPHASEPYDYENCPPGGFCCACLTKIELQQLRSKKAIGYMKWSFDDGGFETYGGLTPNRPDLMLEPIIIASCQLRTLAKVIQYQYTTVDRRFGLGFLWVFFFTGCFGLPEEVFVRQADQPKLGLLGFPYEVNAQPEGDLPPFFTDRITQIQFNTTAKGKATLFDVTFAGACVACD